MAVPFSRLADLIEVSKKEMDDMGLFASILGHIGEFVCHSPTPFLSASLFSHRWRVWHVKISSMAYC